MPEDQPGVVPAAPATPPIAVQAPATPAVPVVTQQAPVTPAAPATPATPPVVPVAPKTEQLLEVPSIPKPTVEALKIPTDSLVPKDKIASIVSQAKTIEEAQSRFDFAHGLYADGQKAMETQNQTRLQELKGDPELGGQKWEETKALYNSGMKRLFGEDAMREVIAAKLDALPWLVRGIVRAERAATAKPIVSGEPIKPEAGKGLQPHERIYGPDKTYDPLKPANPRTVQAPRI